MLKSLLVPIGVLLGGFAVGVGLMAGGHPMLGMLLGLASAPLALVVWVVGSDRY